jgi:hypothetical protein
VSNLTTDTPIIPKRFDPTTEPNITSLLKRVEDAFEHLWDRDIYAYSHLPCCRTCATYEKQERPLVYFHSQDMEYLRQSGILMIRYITGPDSTEEDACKVAREAKAYLELANLDVEWDGDHRKTLQVSLPTSAE